MAGRTEIISDIYRVEGSRDMVSDHAIKRSHNNWYAVKTDTSKGIRILAFDGVTPGHSYSGWEIELAKSKLILKERVSFKQFKDFFIEYSKQYGPVTNLEIFD